MKTNTEKLNEELKALAQMKDEDIDTSDIPEIANWSKAVVGKFYRPIKEPVTIRLDVDIVAWMKSSGPGYQTRINTLLRNAMQPGAAGDRSLEEAELIPARTFQFPSLEKLRELDKYSHVAKLIESRGCFFANAA